MTKRYLLAALFLVLPFMAGTNVSHAADFLMDLKAKAEKVTSIQSRFTQEKHLSMFDEVLISEGSFAFQRPSSLRWEYTTPFKAGFLLTGNTGIEWDEAAQTKREFSLKSSPIMAMVAQQIMAWTTFDIAWLKSRYDITRTGTAPTILDLRPKGEGARKMLTRIIIRFAQDDTTIDSLELREVDEDFTRITFMDRAINTPLSDTLFTSVQ
ncbi:LolA family protein [Pseudodesulfovibrio sediminis]|uniref:Outer membrane lipoprotein carrier protein LolA n=1 Tax=Pseudodesulfovibrio sediminis TaxID=2810563 RepID=A0ABM7P693_9BACT|nr:outer membrane lipoprotein carrier protein LolA [Pseudodesulfovibrio sediminis]BCS88442.1 hypothetical protein PSDVSF_16840 [Pseudodesulfovibrio sediminis]